MLLMTYIILNILAAALKSKKKQMKLILMFYLTFYVQNIVIQHVINIKLLMRYFIFIINF